jgi:hypothetical protein
MRSIYYVIYHIFILQFYNDNVIASINFCFSSSSSFFFFFFLKKNLSNASHSLYIFTVLLFNITFEITIRFMMDYY